VFDQIGEAHGRGATKLSGRRKHRDEEMGGSLSGHQFHVAMPWESLGRIANIFVFEAMVGWGASCAGEKGGPAVGAPYAPESGGRMSDQSSAADRFTLEAINSCN
jgi:hypothetical protein